MLPEGFVYQPEFVTGAEERDLIAAIGGETFSAIRMRGMTARRRVIQYGFVYGFEAFRKLEPGPPVPQFLLPLRERAAALIGVAAGQLSEVLVTEYPPGAVIGWHRDAPMFGTVAGVSLAAPCRLRFRRGKTGAWETTEIALAPRSVYVLDGAARREWQHSIPAVRQLRYSITFRTMRRSA